MGKIADERYSKHVQALHAGISRRDWHATETAANAIRDLTDALSAADALTAGEREPVLWADPQAVADTSLSKHGSYTMPLYTSPPASELEALRKERDEAESALAVAIDDLMSSNSRVATLQARLAEVLKGDREETISAVFQTVGECLAGMTHDQVSEIARRNIEAALHAARRVRDGGQADG